MKSVFALFATLGLSLMTFIGGLVVATFLLHAGETPSRLGGSDVASLWTNEPVRIDPTRNTFERVPGLQVASEVPASGPDGAVMSLAAAAATSHGKDKEPTSVALAATEETGLDAQQAPAMNEAHLDWCSNRYRSYRPRDNSYTAYSGGRHECVSPFPTHAAETVAAANASVSPAPAGQDSFAEDNFGQAADEEPQVVQASLEGPVGFVTEEHAQSCSARYRSYTAEDNTYQPYGGGPRLQCQ